MLNEHVKVQGPAGVQRNVSCHLGRTLSQLAGLRGPDTRILSYVSDVMGQLFSHCLLFKILCYAHVCAHTCQHTTVGMKKSKVVSFTTHDGEHLYLLSCLTGLQSWVLNAPCHSSVEAELGHLELGL